MAADLAEFGVVVTGGDARRELRLTREELIALANGGKLAEDAMKKVIPPTVVPPSVPRQIDAVTASIIKMRQAAQQSQANSMASMIGSLDPFQKAAQAVERTTTAAEKATPSFDRMRGALTQIAVSASGIPGPVGRLASVLGQFSVGGAVTVGVLAGIAAISLAWAALTKESEGQRAENQRVIASFKQMERELSASAKNIRISTLEAQEAALTGRVEQGIRGFGQGDSFWERWSGVGATRAAETAKRQLDDVRSRLALLRQEQAALIREGGGVLMLPAVTTSAQRSRPAASPAIAPNFIPPAGTNSPDPASWFRDIERKRIESAKRAADAAAKAEEDAAKRASAAWQDMHAENMKTLFQIADSLSSVLGNTLGNIDKKMGSGGLVQGVGMGLATGNPYAAGAAIANSFVDALFNWNAEAERGAEQARALQQAHEDLRASLLEQAGVTSAYDSAIARNVRAVRELEEAYQKQIDRIQQLRDKGYQAGSAEVAQAEAARAKIGELRAAMAGYLVAMEAERQARIKAVIDTAHEEGQAALLRALGRDEELAALQRAKKQQEDYAEALKNGATNADLARIAEGHRMSELAAGIERSRTKIQALTATIDGLQDFRNSLLLSATQSPTTRLAEARRQYADVLGVVQGADIKKAQEASGRLPGVAQVLLDASRTVNASGAGFQSDFAKVLADSAAAITRFQDLRTVEEAMLAELIKIANATMGLRDSVTRPIGTMPAGLVAGTDVVSELRAQVDVLQDGFSRLLDATTQTNARLDTLDRTIDRGLGAISANVLA